MCNSSPAASKLELELTAWQVVKVAPGLTEMPVCQYSLGRTRTTLGFFLCEAAVAAGAGQVQGFPVPAPQLLVHRVLVDFAFLVIRRGEWVACLLRQAMTVNRAHLALAGEVECLKGRYH